jgi:hypothetical protein
MSSSAVVDKEYRLTPADFAQGEQALIVTNVSFQGLEEIRPVLHFRGQSKWLVCDPGQCNDLARITKSAVCSDWIGSTLLVAVVEDEQGSTIQLKAAPVVMPTMETKSGASRSPAPWLGSLAVIMLLGLLFLLVFLLERSDALWDTLLGLF